MLLNVRINTKSVTKIEKFEEELKSERVKYHKILSAFYPTFILWMNDEVVKIPYNSYIRQASLTEW